MSSEKSSILIIEDTPSLAMVYQEYIRKEGSFTSKVVDTGKAALAKIAEKAPQVILLDLQLPDMNGIKILEYVKENNLSTSVVVVTANGSVSVAVEAMKQGAFDFLVKPFTADRLIVTLKNALERENLKSIVETYRQDFGREQFQQFIGSSDQMQTVYKSIESVASSKASVFITGESGTGKELCAEAIHKVSPRQKASFVALNCAAIPKDLIESEIFGHVKGAFTGATSDRIGAAKQSNGGTLFLDEICEMDLNLQSKLLRFIQTGTYQAVGSSKLEAVDVRFVCATNRDPLEAVNQGLFREDLYYRLHVVPIHMPSLHKRGDDVLLIAKSFLEKFSAEENKRFEDFNQEVQTRLKTYEWPGNVRQLQNIIRNIVVLHDGKEVTAEMLPPPLDQMGPGMKAAEAYVKDQMTRIESGESLSSIRPLWEIERDAIESAIALNDGNIPKAAAQLEISPSTIYRKKMSWEEEGKI